MKREPKQPSQISPITISRRLYGGVRNLIRTVKRTVASLTAMAAVVIGFVYVNQDKSETFRDWVQWGEGQVEYAVDAVKSQSWATHKEDDIDRLVSGIKRRSESFDQERAVRNFLGR